MKPKRMWTTEGAKRRKRQRNLSIFVGCIIIKATITAHITDLIGALNMSLAIIMAIAFMVSPTVFQEKPEEEHGDN